MFISKYKTTEAETLKLVPVIGGFASLGIPFHSSICLC